VSEEKQTAQIGGPSPEKTVQAKEPKNQKMKQQSQGDKTAYPRRVYQYQGE
jgi:hypothetical protein